MDPKGSFQGPFSTRSEMKTWYSMGYFRPQLSMRWRPDMEFQLFQDIFKEFNISCNYFLNNFYLDYFIKIILKNNVIIPIHT